jgi:hypothetical protein
MLGSNKPGSHTRGHELRSRGEGEVGVTPRDCRRLVILAALSCALAEGRSAAAATTVVTGGADTLADDAVYTLREAILAANADTASGATAGQCAAGSPLLAVDRIHFAIPGAGVRTIALGSPLPAITEAVVVDGYTQPGAHANTLAGGDDAVLLIELDGTSAGSTGFDGLVLAGGCTVRGRCQVGASRCQVGARPNDSTNHDESRNRQHRWA